MWPTKVTFGDIVLVRNTTDANRQLAAIQERMPVILEMTDWRCGLATSRETSLPSFVRCQTACCKRVGRVRNDGPDLLEPLRGHHTIYTKLHVKPKIELNQARFTNVRCGREVR
jgi:hypothetical protein